MSRGRAHSRPSSERPALPQSSPPSLWRWAPIALLVCYAILTLGHLASTPVVTQGSLINAPDESAHIGYVRALAVHHRLPSASDVDFRTYQWHQPPFYYLLCASAFRGGTYAMRLVSFVIGLCGLLALWWGARRVLPDDPRSVSLAVGFGALLAMRHAVSGAVGNDGLIELLFSVAIVLSIAVAQRTASDREVVLLGVALGAAMLTKSSAILLVPVAALALAIGRAHTWRGRRALAAAGACAAFLILSAPWAVRNVRLYGEATPVAGFRREFEGTSKALDWIDSRPVRVDPVSGELVHGPVMDRTGYTMLLANWTARTFYAAYTPLNRAAIGAPVFLPAPFYFIWWGVTCVGLVGSIVAVRRRAVSAPTAGVLLSSILLVSTAFAGFTWTYFQAQGRYLFPVLLPISILWAVGVEALTPRRHRDAAALAGLSVLLLLAVAFLLTTQAAGTGR